MNDPTLTSPPFFYILFAIKLLVPHTQTIREPITPVKMTAHCKRLSLLLFYHEYKPNYVLNGISVIQRGKGSEPSVLVAILQMLLPLLTGHLTPGTPIQHIQETYTEREIP